VHSDSHTPVPRVGSGAKLGEGSTQRVYVCEGVSLVPNYEVHEVKEPDLIVVMSQCHCDGLVLLLKQG